MCLAGNLFETQPDWPAATRLETRTKEWYDGASARAENPINA